MNTSKLNPSIERQVGTTFDAIRDDHKERYIWASERVKESDDVIDAGCGVGYGSALLAEHSKCVHAIDISKDAIAYATKYWANPKISYEVQDLCFFKMAKSRRFDIVVAFEVLEHLIEPRLFLIRAFEALKPGGRIFVSVPNEKIIPHTVSLNPFHLRHYTFTEIKAMLLECGFEVTAVASQNTNEVVEDDKGKFLILESVRREKLPASFDHAEVLEHALNSAASFIVDRAMALHKATKDMRALKSKLDEASKSLVSGEVRSELQQKMLQFLEGVQAQSNSSRELLVTDMIRRLKEVETFERELRERLMQAEVQHARALEEVRHAEIRCMDQTAIAKKLSTDLESSRDDIEKIARDMQLVLQKSGDERMALESEIVALKEQADKAHAMHQEGISHSAQLSVELEAMAHQRDDLKDKIQQTLLELDAAKKQASSSMERSNSMAVRLLAVARDHNLVMEANAELVQKMGTSETEISRLTRKIESLQIELQSNYSTTVKTPPTLGKIYKKLRFHRFYVPFLYKAVRNSIRNQLKPFRAKGKF